MRKFSPQILGHVWLPLAAQVNIRESFLYENRQFAKVFSLESFPLYSIYMYTCHIWVPDKTCSYLNGCVNILFKQYTLYMYLLIHKLEPVDISPSISFSVPVLVEGMGTRGVHMCTVGLALTVL